MFNSTVAHFLRPAIAIASACIAKNMLPTCRPASVVHVPLCMHPGYACDAEVQQCDAGDEGPPWPLSPGVPKTPSTVEQTWIENARLQALVDSIRAMAPEVLAAAEASLSAPPAGNVSPRKNRLDATFSGGPRDARARPASASAARSSKRSPERMHSRLSGTSGSILAGVSRLQGENPFDRRRPASAGPLGKAKRKGAAPAPSTLGTGWHLHQRVAAPSSRFACDGLHVVASGPRTQSRVPSHTRASGLTAQVSSPELLYF